MGLQSVVCGRVRKEAGGKVVSLTEQGPQVLLHETGVFSAVDGFQDGICDEDAVNDVVADLVQSLCL